MTLSRRWAAVAVFAILSVPRLSSLVGAQTIEAERPPLDMSADAQNPAPANRDDSSRSQPSPEAAQVPRLVCTSAPGTREHCTADTSSGVVLARSTGSAPCLLGKTWGYDDTGIWVSDGCSGEFVVGQATQPTPPERTRPLEHVPNVGFLLYNGDKGQIYFRLFSYARYLNQLEIDDRYTDAFGNAQTVKQRQ